MEKINLIEYFGSTVKVAKALQVTQPAVSQWPESLTYSVIGRLAVLQPRAWRELNRKKKAANGSGEQSTRSGENS